MDSTNEVKSGEKRLAVDAQTGGGPLPKKFKTGGLGEGVMGNTSKVAEMVLLLAAMGKMRGGRVPSQVELDIMSTAREKLAELCQCFPPKDLFPREVFGAIIEDLGLDRINEQKLQFRPPKVTIAEKFLLSKRKMEKSEDLSQYPATSGSQWRLSTNSGVTVENHGSPHAVGVLSSDKSNHKPIASGNFQTASPSSLPYQLPTSEVRPVSSTPVSVQRTDRPHFNTERWSNGLSNVLYPQANKGVKETSDAKSRMVSQTPASKQTIGQSSSGNIRKLHQHSQVVNPIQAANPRNTHVEIGNIVLKALQPQSSELPMWTPPSRDYMNQPLPCQICRSTINDMDSVLVCDTCEKSFHLKCLQINNARGIPKGDWHCRRCLQLSHGKPLPSKYGRVMRNTSASKVPLNTSSSPQLNKKTGSLDDKVNQHKGLPNGNTELPGVPNVAEGKKAEEENSTASGMDIVSPSVPSVKGVREEKMLDLKAVPVSMSETNNSLSGNSHSCDNKDDIKPHDDALTAKQTFDNHILDKSLNDICSEEGLRDNIRQESEMPLSDGVNSVDWVGDMLRVDDNKIFYHSCSINGVIYKLHDHVLIHISDDRSFPSKLQWMWEDSRTKIKWVTVNRCYFPGDLPEAVGRPCSLESSEVYESTCGLTVMAGLIRGLCDVLPPANFSVEKERRSSLGLEESNNLRPLYFSKWIYDESKGIFRDGSL